MQVDFRGNPKSNGCGVYAIINAYNLTVYVGCTRNLKKRAQTHKELLKRGKHYNKILQEACKSGITRFVVLEELPDDIGDLMLRLKEMMYIRDFCKRPNYIVCNKESKNREMLENNILFTLGYIWNVEGNVKTSFTNEYGTAPWNMVTRSKKRRVC